MIRRKFVKKLLAGSAIAVAPAGTLLAEVSGPYKKNVINNFSEEESKFIMMYNKYGSEFGNIKINHNTKSGRK